MADKTGVEVHPFGGWGFWLIALVPFIRAGEIVPGLLAGTPFKFAESLLDLGLVGIGAALIAGRFLMPAASLSPTVLSVRPFPFLPPREIQRADIASVNWVSGSTLGLKLRSTGDTSVSMMLMAKQHREAVADGLRNRIAG